MCQVCPNRNDCLKAIFSNLSDFRAPSLIHPMTPERQIKTSEEHNNHFRQALMNARTTLCFQHSHLMRDTQCNSRAQRDKTRPAVLTNSHRHNFHASALLSPSIQMCSAFIHSLLFELKSLTTFTHPKSIILTWCGQRQQNKERDE